MGLGVNVKTVHIIGVVLAIAALFAGAYFLGTAGSTNSTGFLTLAGNETENQAQTTEETNINLPESTGSIYDQSEYERFAELVSREKQIEAQRRPQRDQYGVFPEVFDDLPPIPNDFGTMVYLFEIGMWRNLDYFTEDYYLQPEFYKTRGDFAKICLTYWTEPHIGMHALQGWGAYPGDMWVNTYRGATFKVKTFWFVPCGIEQYQGFNLNYLYPLNSQNEAEATYNNQDPAVVKNYFDVRIIDKEFLLGPTYPKFSINPPFARPVEVEITVKENAVPGEYVLGIETMNVSDEQHDEWLLKYKALYNDAAAGFATINRPHWRLNITVN